MSGSLVGPGEFSVKTHFSSETNLSHEFAYKKLRVIEVLKKVLKRFWAVFSQGRREVPRQIK